MGRKIRSPVWDYFTKAYGGSSRSKASCNACLKQVLFCGNTTNLISHLRLKHSAIYSEIHSSSNKEPQMTICPTMAGLFATEDCSRDSIVSQSSDHAATGNQIIRFNCTIFVMLFYIVMAIIDIISIIGYWKYLLKFFDKSISKNTETMPSFG